MVVSRAPTNFGRAITGIKLICMIQAKKELGQNFLSDPQTLDTIVGYAGLSQDDTVLEIGPGLGSLTGRLCRAAGQVVAVEFDRDLAMTLGNRLDNGSVKPSNLTIINDDILKYDLTGLVPDYKVVANIPYNITSKIIQNLWSSDNKPQMTVLLVQKEVAERLAAPVGKLSILAISAQIFADIELGVVVPAEMFEPVPKVDSQVVIMRRRDQQLVDNADLKRFFYVVKAGFGEKRKKLRSSLAVGLRTSKQEAERLLNEANIDPNKRAQELTSAEWKRLAKCD